MIFIEEANQTFADDKANRYDLGDGPGLGFLRSARKIDGDTSVIMTDQVPSELHRSVIANCENVICFALVDSKDVREVGSAAGLERYLQRELVELGPREVIARLGRYKRRALKIQVDEITFPQPISREEARRRSQGVLDGIPYVKRAPKKDGGARVSEGGLPPEERGWFAAFVREPWLLTSDRMKASGLDRDAHDHIRAKFEARGCVAFDSKVGAKYKIYRPTPRGLKLGHSLGLAAGSPHKGSVAHECIVAYTQRSLDEYFRQKRGDAVSFARTGVSSSMNGVQPDSVGVRPAGSRFVLQACCHNAAGYEADALLKLHALTLVGPGHADAVELVLAVARNKTHRKAIEKAIKERNNGIVPDNVVVMDFDTALKADWGEVFAD